MRPTDRDGWPAVRRMAEAEKPSDRQLLHRFIRHRDEQAFAMLVHRYGDMVRNACRRWLRHLHDVEDACQVVFLVLARKAHGMVWQESVAGWLYQVAFRVAADVRKKTARRRAREVNLDPLPDMCVYQPLDRDDASSLLEACLRHLPSSYQDPLLLCCVEGLTRKEAAQRLGWTHGMVKGRLERGRRLLRWRFIRANDRLARC